MPDKLPTRLDEVVPIDPDLYRDVLESLTLQSISLDRVQASCQRESFGDSGIDVRVTAEGNSRQTEDQYLTFVTYQLRGRRDEALLMEIDATYRVAFTTGVTVPDGFFEVFQEINLPMTTMPYFRELVASTMARMLLPPLTLPYMVFGAPQEEPADDGEVSVSKTTASKPKRKKG